MLKHLLKSVGGPSVKKKKNSPFLEFHFAAHVQVALVTPSWIKFIEKAVTEQTDPGAIRDLAEEIGFEHLKLF